MVPSPTPASRGGFEVRGCTVLITGAASGMGRLYAELAARDGAARIVVWDRTRALVGQATSELRAKYPAVDWVPVAQDLADPASTRRACENLVEKGIVPQVLINNAGIVRSNRYFWVTDPHSDVTATIMVNLLAPMLITAALLPAMIAQGKPGRVVNIASAAGTLGNPRMASYAGSKAGLLGWSDSLRIELGDQTHGAVRVTTVTPSYITTGMFAGATGPVLAPLLDPHRVVARVWRAMLRGEAFVFLPWSVRLARVLKAVLPTAMFDRVVGRWLGVYSSMDGFVGRGGNDGD